MKFVVLIVTKDGLLSVPLKAISSVRYLTKSEEYVIAFRPGTKMADSTGVVYEDKTLTIPKAKMPEGTQRVLFPMF